MTAADLTHILAQAQRQKQNQRMARRLRAWLAIIFAASCAIGAGVVLLDVFVWRPLP